MGLGPHLDALGRGCLRGGYTWGRAMPRGVSMWSFTAQHMGGYRCKADYEHRLPYREGSSSKDLHLLLVTGCDLAMVLRLHARAHTVQNIVGPCVFSIVPMAARDVGEVRQAVQEARQFNERLLAGDACQNPKQAGQILQCNHRPW